MKKEIWKMMAVCMTVSVLSGCSAEKKGSEPVKEEVSVSSSVSAEETVHVNLWDGFSAGGMLKDDYSFRNSTNTYRNDPEGGYGLVYQSISGEKEEKTLQLHQDGAEILSITYVTDETLYYYSCDAYDGKKEQYTGGKLWRVPLKKTEGLDQMTYCYWCGVTEQGGFLCGIRHKTKGDEPHLEESIYVVNRSDGF